MIPHPWFPSNFQFFLAHLRTVPSAAITLKWLTISTSNALIMRKSSWKYLTQGLQLRKPRWCHLGFSFLLEMKRQDSTVSQDMRHVLVTKRSSGVQCILVFWVTWQNFLTNLSILVPPNLDNSWFTSILIIHLGNLYQVFLQETLACLVVDKHFICKTLSVAHDPLPFACCCSETVVVWTKLSPCLGHLCIVGFEERHVIVFSDFIIYIYIYNTSVESAIFLNKLWKQYFWTLSVVEPGFALVSPAVSHVSWMLFFSRDATSALAWHGTEWARCPITKCAYHQQLSLKSNCCNIDPTIFCSYHV